MHDHGNDHISFSYAAHVYMGRGPQVRGLNIGYACWHRRAIMGYERVLYAALAAVDKDTNGVTILYTYGVRTVE